MNISNDVFGPVGSCVMNSVIGIDHVIAVIVVFSGELLLPEAATTCEDRGKTKLDCDATTAGERVRERRPMGVNA